MNCKLLDTFSCLANATWGDIGEGIFFIVIFGLLGLFVLGMFIGVDDD